MILNDLFESRMSELDIEYQDYKNLEPVAFYSRYKMTKDEWASKHWSLIKSSETMHEESQDDRNARIIAGEIEDAMSLGNEKVAQEKIKKLSQLGYYFDKQGRLQRMGMYEEQDACYRKVKSRYKVWPSAYASGALVQCRKKGAANWGTGAKKK
jgi:hypothetical protein